LEADTAIDKARRSELRRALLAWIAKGGFAPDWKAYPFAAKAFKEWQRKFGKFQDLAR